MRIACDMVSTLIVIFNLIGLGSQFDCLPNGEPIPVATRRERSSLPSFSDIDSSLPPGPPHQPDRFPALSEPSLRGRLPAISEPSLRGRLPAVSEPSLRGRLPAVSNPSLHVRQPALSNSSLRAKPPASAEPPLRARSKSPPARYMTPTTRFLFYDVLGYGPDQLQFIRLTSNKNRNRIFELRKYTFPADTPLRLLAGQSTYKPVPRQEQIVLSTFDGELFAIFEKNNILSGMYGYNNPTHCTVRVKINMQSGKITRMTPGEIKEAPVGRQRPIRFYFKVDRINNDDLRQ